MRINYRAPDNSPRRPAPTLLAELPVLATGSRILLVDDVSVSGQTLNLARELLKQHEVIAFTLKGKADFVLFPEIESCVNWPWNNMNTAFFIVMGVSGCGKSSVGKALAERLGWDFYDADDFHPPENIAKMADGIPLDDSDRAPWLVALHDLISHSLKADSPGVLACSALRERYRQQLLNGNDGVRIVYLKGSYDLIWSRMEKWADHYMKPHMLKSQFEALEEPTNALTVDISMSVEEIVRGILTHMG